MQYFTTILAAATVASAAAVLPRQEYGQGNFLISDLTFSGAAHSTQSIHTLKVSKQGDSSPGTTCSLTTSTSPKLGTFDSTSCADATWRFSFLPQDTSKGPGYNLQIVHAPAGGDEELACQWYPSSDVTTVSNPEDPNGSYEHLNAPQSFTVSYDPQSCAIV